MDKTLVIELDNLIRSGRSQLARSKLNLRLSVKRQKPIARENLSTFVALSRRCGIPAKGVELLSSVIRTQRKKFVIPTPEEKVEYAACLNQLGATEEAAKLLDEVIQSKQEIVPPSARLFRAFTHFSKWQYSEALPLLLAYCDDEKLEAYARFIGKVNLLAAQINTRSPDALFFANELLEYSKIKNYRSIETSILELKAQAFIDQKLFEQAKKCLDEASTRSMQMGIRESLWIEKWKWINESQMQSKPSVGEYHRLCTRARELRDWESLRDIDLHMGIFESDVRLLSKVYLGTPYLSFKSRVENRIYENCRRSKSLLNDIRERKIEFNNGSNVKTFDMNLQEVQLKPGQILHRFLLAIFSDAYRPQTTSSLFEKVYPGQFYHPVNSYITLHQVLSRIRRWLKEQRIPIQIKPKMGEFHIESKLKLQVLYSRQTYDAQEKKLSIVAQLLKDQLEHEDAFTAKSVSNLFKVSHRSANRILRQVQTEGVIEQIGNGRSRKYRLR